MSLYTPIFPPSHKSYSRSRAHQPMDSYASTTPSDNVNRYAELLRDVHLFLSTKNEVLSPPSAPSSPTSEVRALQLRQNIREAFQLAGREPSNGKWSYVSDKLKMGCVRGRYRWVSRKNRQAEEEEEGQNWILPDTEQVWFDWEKAREGAKEEQRNLVENQQGKEMAWAKRINGTEGPQHNGGARVGELDKPTAAESMADCLDTVVNVNEKVKRWRATMDAEGTGCTATRSAKSSQNKAIHKAVAKGKVQEQDPKDPSPLGFQVVKHVSATVTGKKGKGPPGRPALLESQDGVDHHFQDSIHKDTDKLIDKDRPVVDSDGDINMASSNPAVPTLPLRDQMPKIVDLPEQSQPPPSFPSQLETSTPPQKEPLQPERAKPPISSTRIPLSPRSSPYLANSFPRVYRPLNSDNHDADTANMSSSLPVRVTPRAPSKRYRPPTPPSGAMTISPQVLSLASPPRKKARPTPVFDGSPTPPPRSITPMRTPTPSVTNSKGLGNARNLPIPVTPDRDLPTLTELLASSRRSKRRPRPPSRRNTQSIPEEQDEINEAHSAPLRDRTPTREADLSPAKSYFSSPASGYSDSPGVEDLHLRSVTPMMSFTQNPNAFMPQYTSSQQPPFGRVGSGFFGYNSQFDVEGQVDRVSELLEKDVDFDGWLRKTPLMEEASQ